MGLNVSDESSFALKFPTAGADSSHTGLLASAWSPVGFTSFLQSFNVFSASSFRHSKTAELTGRL